LKDLFRSLFRSGGVVLSLARQISMFCVCTPVPFPVPFLRGRSFLRPGCDLKKQAALLHVPGLVSAQDQELFEGGEHVAHLLQGHAGQAPTAARLVGLQGVQQLAVTGSDRA
jgi:hypothetical protein